MNYGLWRRRFIGFIETKGESIHDEPTVVDKTEFQFYDPYEDKGVIILRIDLFSGEMEEVS